jgi:hypothetical protein
MPVGTTDERETVAQTERSRDSDNLSSNFTTFPSPSSALIAQAIDTGFHDTFASAAAVEKAAEAATEAQAARSHTPANQHAPLSLIPPGGLQQPTATYAYNPIPSVAGRISCFPATYRYDVSVTQPYPYRDLALASSYETLPRYAERGSPGQSQCH